MSENTINTDELVINSTGPLPSIIFNEPTEPVEEEKMEEAESIKQFGNGNLGSGFPGERMVNNPALDIPLFPNITQSETSIARFGNNIVFGFNDSNGATQFNYSGIAFSSDNGVTWSDSGSLPKGTFQRLSGDPVIAADSNGIFYYGSLARSAAGQDVISVSTAQVIGNFLIVNDPIIVGQGLGFQDKEWIAVGPNKLLPGSESLYITWTDFLPPPSNVTNIRFAKFSTGLNPTVQISSYPIPTIPSGVQGSFVLVDKNGTIYVFYEAYSSQIPFPANRSIRMVKSVDGGVTFSNPIIVAPTVISASTNLAQCGRPAILVEQINATTARMIRMSEFPHAAIDPAGNLYVVWNGGTDITPTGTSNVNIFLAYSQDGGENWNRLPVTTNSTHEIYPSVIFHCGEAHIQYTRFNDPNNVGGVGNRTFSLFKKSFSIANGFSSETRVSTADSPVPITSPNFDIRVANCYMGDYNQIIAGPGNTLYHSWGDNRFILNGANNPDVFFIQTNCKEKEPTRGIDYRHITIL